MNNKQKITLILFTVVASAISISVILLNINDIVSTFSKTAIVEESPQSKCIADNDHFWNTPSRYSSVYLEPFCDRKYFAFSDYIAGNWSTSIVHTTNAEILEFKDSAKREVITLGNSHFILDNFTNPMKIGDQVKIFEINHHPNSCISNALHLYNNTILRGQNMTKFMVSEGKNWYQLDVDGYADTQNCNDFTTFSEVEAN